MPRNHKPSKVSQALTQLNGGSKYSAQGNGHRCPKSPTGGHWWKIGSPDGSLSAGVCRYCGKQGWFANTMDMALRGRAK